MSNQAFIAALESYIAGCNSIYLNQLPEGFPESCIDKFGYREGKKYIKVTKGTSVHSFIDIENGDVLLPAGWKAPAKGARGNIYDAKNGLGRMGAHGPAYNK